MMRQKIHHILFTGVGGQGILVASQIAAETALAAGYDVKKAEVHGMAQRGGSVVSHVRFGPEVFSPLISRSEADYLVAFEPLEALRYLDYARPGGVIILNQQRILPQTVRVGDALYPDNIEEICRQVAGQVVSVQAGDIAESLGNRRAANVLLLGILSRFLDFPMDHWLQAIRRRVPAKSFSLNQQAFARGRVLAEENSELVVPLRQSA